LADVRYLFFGSLAFDLRGQSGGDWSQAFARTITRNQTLGGALDGSFASADSYTDLFGRAYGAAMIALSIENAWRVTLK
jgi:hypothetical protein